MRQRTPEAGEQVCNHLGCLSVSVGAGRFTMLYGTELLDVFAFVQNNIAVLILGIPRSALGACVLVELTRAKGVFYTLHTLVIGVLSAGHIDITNMFGRKQVAVRLEHLVVRRWSETRTSRGSSEL
eukprot:896960-Pyramimonas_sp.AAC.1